MLVAKDWLHALSSIGKRKKGDERSGGSRVALEQKGVCEKRDHVVGGATKNAAS